MVEVIIEAAIALAVVILALVIALRLACRWPDKKPSAQPAPLGPAVFLFDGDKLIDTTMAAQTLLPRLSGTSLNALLIWLEQKLPGASDTLRQAEAEGRAELTGASGSGTAQLRLRAEALGADMMRLTIIDPEAPVGGILVDPLSQRALEEEAAILRHAMDGAPILAWRQDDNGVLTWANEAYMAAAEAYCLQKSISLWPLPQILPLSCVVSDGAAKVERYEYNFDGETLWYDCHIRPLGDETIIFALPADAAVRAERSLREFVQTLTKTFADLPIGLAIFDRDRNLQLFNPALIDLTNLSANLLISKPSLFAFLDHLRERRMIPEPKDYRSWRRQIATLEAAAAEGHHVETWSLPGGQTYRVTGRPHPDGAIAFLFEDITSETTLSRRFRADISLGINAMDALGDAIAVFSDDRKPLLSNALWRQTWGSDIGLNNLALTIQERLGHQPPGHTEFRRHIDGPFLREGATGEFELPSGNLLSWRSAPMPAGKMLLHFSGAGLEDIASAPLIATDKTSSENATSSRAQDKAIA